MVNKGEATTLQLLAHRLRLSGGGDKGSDKTRSEGEGEVARERWAREDWQREREEWRGNGS